MIARHHRCVETLPELSANSPADSRLSFRVFFLFLDSCTVDAAHLRRGSGPLPVGALPTQTATPSVQSNNNNVDMMPLLSKAFVFAERGTGTGESWPTCGYSLLTPVFLVVHRNRNRLILFLLCPEVHGFL